MGEGDDIGEENGDEDREEHPDMDLIRRRSKSGSITIGPVRFDELQVISLLSITVTITHTQGSYA